MEFLRRNGSRLLGCLCLVLGLSAASCSPLIESEENSMARNTVPGWGRTGELATGGGVDRGGRGFTTQFQLPEPGSLTLQFNLQPPKTGAPPNCRAIIESSVAGGASVKRIVTVLDGSSVTVRGEAVTVTVRDFTSINISTGQEYKVGVLGTPGARAGSKQPPLLAPLVFTTSLGGVPNAIDNAIVVPTGSTFFVPVDEDAGIISVHVVAFNGATLTNQEVFVRMLRDAGTLMKAYDPLTWADWVPLAPSTRTIGLRNLHPVDDVSFGIIFGIDG